MSDEENREVPVTVAQMIEALQKLPPDARLFVSGYEDGYEDATLPSGTARVFCLNVNTEWYYGPHDEDCRRYTNNSAKRVLGYFL